MQEIKEDDDRNDLVSNIKTTEFQTFIDKNFSKTFGIICRDSIKAINDLNSTLKLPLANHQKDIAAMLWHIMNNGVKFTHKSSTFPAGLIGLGMISRDSAYKQLTNLNEPGKSATSLEKERFVEIKQLLTNLNNHFAKLKFAFLASPPGTGKTFIVIAITLLSDGIIPGFDTSTWIHQDGKIGFGSETFLHTYKTSRYFFPINLIITPTKEICTQWIDSYTKFTSKKNVKALMTPMAFYNFFKKYIDRFDIRNVQYMKKYKTTIDWVKHCIQNIEQAISKLNNKSINSNSSSVEQPIVLSEIDMQKVYKQVATLIKLPKNINSCLNFFSLVKLMPNMNIIQLTHLMGLFVEIRTAIYKRLEENFLADDDEDFRLVGSVIIIPASVLAENNNIFLALSIVWMRVIIDECDKDRLLHLRNLQALFSLLISGTLNYFKDDGRRPGCETYAYMLEGLLRSIKNFKYYDNITPFIGCEDGYCKESFSDILYFYPIDENIERMVIDVPDTTNGHQKYGGDNDHNVSKTGIINKRINDSFYTTYDDCTYCKEKIFNPIWEQAKRYIKELYELNKKFYDGDINKFKMCIFFKPNKLSMADNIKILCENENIRFYDFTKRGNKLSKDERDFFDVSTVNDVIEKSKDKSYIMVYPLDKLEGLNLQTLSNLVVLQFEYAQSVVVKNFESLVRQLYGRLDRPVDEEVGKEISRKITIFDVTIGTQDCEIFTIRKENLTTKELGIVLTKKKERKREEWINDLKRKIVNVNPLKRPRLD